MKYATPTHSKTSTLILAALLLPGIVASQAVTIAPSGDTYLTEHAGLGGPSSNHPSDTFLLAIGAPFFLSYPLLKFDLAPFAGQTVIGDATLSLYVESVFGLAAPRTVSVHEVLIDWAAETVTYNSFGPAAGVQFGTDVTSSIASRSVGGAGAVPQYVSWTIPGSAIQNWIDDPTSNKGFLVNNQETLGSRDLGFNSVQSTNDPQLVFTVPEPSTILLAAIGLCGIAARRTRNRPNA